MFYNYAVNRTTENATYSSFRGMVSPLVTYARPLRVALHPIAALQRSSDVHNSSIFIFRVVGHVRVSINKYTYFTCYLGSWPSDMMSCSASECHVQHMGIH